MSDCLDDLSDEGFKRLGEKVYDAMEDSDKAVEDGGEDGGEAGGRHGCVDEVGHDAGGRIVGLLGGKMGRSDRDGRRWGKRGWVGEYVLISLREIDLGEEGEEGGKVGGGCGYMSG